MAIAPILNGETLASVTGKINQSFEDINENSGSISTINTRLGTVESQMTTLIVPTANPSSNAFNPIRQFTKPTIRTDGSALVIGDIWYNPSNQMTGYWNGTYWLSSQMAVDGSPVQSSNSGAFGSNAYMSRKQYPNLGFANLPDIFISSAGIITTINADQSNYWTVNLSFTDGAGTDPTLIKTINYNANIQYTEFFSNTVLSNSYFAYLVLTGKVGLPSNFFGRTHINYSWIL